MRKQMSFFSLCISLGIYFSLALGQSGESSATTSTMQPAQNLPACIVFASKRIIPNIQNMQYLLEVKYRNVCGQCLNVSFTMLINNSPYPQYGIHTFQPNVPYTDNYSFTGASYTQVVDLVVSGASPCTTGAPPPTPPSSGVPPQQCTAPNDANAFGPDGISCGETCKNSAGVTQRFCAIKAAPEPRCRDLQARTMARGSGGPAATTLSMFEDDKEVCSGSDHWSEKYWPPNQHHEGHYVGCVLPKLLLANQRYVFRFDLTYSGVESQGPWIPTIGLSTKPATCP